MGFLDKFVRRQETEEGYHGKVNRLGMTILNDEKLMARLGVYEELQTLISEDLSAGLPEDLDDIDDQARKINEVLHQAAIPWGRAGTERWYAEAMRGWSTLYTRMIDITSSARSMIGKGGAKASDSEKRELINKVWNFFQNIYVRYALLIAELSWYRDDVSPSWSTVIMQQPQFPERPVTSFGAPRPLDPEMKRGP